MSEETIFHKIAAGTAPAHVIAEDEYNLAFLDIFPFRAGQTVVIPKQFAPSQFSLVPTEVMTRTCEFAQKVAQQLEEKIEGLYRVLVVVEGLEIEYFHVKLIPAYSPTDGIPTGGSRASDDELERLANLLNSAS